MVCDVIVLPYSLKFSWLKNFAVFVGYILTKKILSREIFSTCIIYVYIYVSLASKTLSPLLFVMLSFMVEGKGLATLA